MFQHFPIFLVNPCDFDAVWNLIGVAMTEYMGINRSLLPQNNGNLPFPFFVVITQLFSWIKLLIIVYIYLLVHMDNINMIIYVIRNNWR